MINVSGNFYYLNIHIYDTYNNRSSDFIRLRSCWAICFPVSVLISKVYNQMYNVLNYDAYFYCYLFIKFTIHKLMKKTIITYQLQFSLQNNKSV